MTISTRVIADAGVTTFITTVGMSTQFGSTAEGYCRSNLQVLQWKPMGLQICRSELAKDILHFNT